MNLYNCAILLIILLSKTKWNNSSEILYSRQCTIKKAVETALLYGSICMMDRRDLNLITSTPRALSVSVSEEEAFETILCKAYLRYNYQHNRPFRVKPSKLSQHLRTRLLIAHRDRRKTCRIQRNQSHTKTQRTTKLSWPSSIVEGKLLTWRAELGVSEDPV